MSAPAFAARPVRVAVAVATCRRPAMLADLLASLARQEPGDEPADVCIIVVDNDAAGSARAGVDAARPAIPYPLHYAVEPEQNISLARNRAARMALAWHADFVAFIDDDEVAAPAWLRELLRAQRGSEADAVQGAVLPRYPGGVAPWVVRGAFFDAPNPPPGSPLTTARTGNVLVAARLLDVPEGPFHPGFGRSGGGDSLFFMGWHRRGARLVSAPQAVAWETIPETRARAGWILRRAFRGGNGAVWCERALPPPLRRLHTRVPKAAARMLMGVALLPPSLLLGRRGAVRALWNAFYGAGAMAALLGYRYEEYRQVHGR